MENNWITIFDNTASATIVYVSESVADHLGWDPKDLIGTNAYDYFHPIDRDSLRKVHIANVMNEKMSSMVSYRFLKPDGSFAHVETVIHYCFDELVTTNFLYDESAIDHKMRANSVDEVFVCQPDGSLQLVGAWNDKQDHMERSLQVDHQWISNKIVHNQERRFCLILNRFTKALNIVYASRLITDLVGITPNNALGRSFYEFVSERDLVILESQMDIAKEDDMVVRLRFDWLIDREKGVSEPIEAITSSTDDGLVVVLRLAPRLFMSEEEQKSQNLKYPQFIAQ
jgi:PAS domain S-box-containing protein